MTNLNFKIFPKYNRGYNFPERLSNCLHKLDQNNPANFITKPNWAKEPIHFVYNVQYSWKNINQVIFSVGFLGEEYIKYYNIDPVKQPYWCGFVKFDDNSGKLFIDNIGEWEYSNEMEGSKKDGWIYKTSLKDLFRVEVELI